MVSTSRGRDSTVVSRFTSRGCHTHHFCSSAGAGEEGAVGHNIKYCLSRSFSIPCNKKMHIISQPSKLQ